ncbi:MAG: DUF5715 family protein [Gemmatimonadaceae bacterium]
MRTALISIAILAAPFLMTALAPTAGAQSLRGSVKSVNRMYRHAVSHELYFYRTSAGVRTAAERGRFVRLKGNEDFALHEVGYPFVRQETRVFVLRLAEQYRDACGEQLVVTSAVRPRSGQPDNASRRSVHPTGMAIDIRKPRGRCLRWLRSTLVSLEKSDVIEATEEFYPPHFHVAVFPDPYRDHVEELGGDPRLNTDSGERYEIRRGDSLWEIATRFGTTVDELKRVNELTASTVFPGQEILVPSAR